ncbi:MAG: hypothetical protein ACXVSA_09265 [Solirubrobacteraceae bacterium]
MPRTADPDLHGLARARAAGDEAERDEAAGASVADRRSQSAVTQQMDLRLGGTGWCRLSSGESRDEQG